MINLVFNGSFLLQLFKAINEVKSFLLQISNNTVPDAILTTQWLTLPLPLLPRSLQLPHLLLRALLLMYYTCTFYCSLSLSLFLLYFTLPYFTLPYLTLSDLTSLYFTWFYFTLLYLYFTWLYPAPSHARDTWTERWHSTCTRHRTRTQRGDRDLLRKALHNTMTTERRSRTPLRTTPTKHMNSLGSSKPDGNVRRAQASLVLLDLDSETWRERLCACIGCKLESMKHRLAKSKHARIEI